jgi:pimeloyl-ACP methyl ester carboxylesterase
MNAFIRTLMAFTGFGFCICICALLTGCPEDSTARYGILQVVNDRTPTVVELYISPSDDDVLGDNLLDSRLPKGYLFEIYLSPGRWDIFTVDTNNEIRYALNVSVLKGQTRAVYLSGMTVYHDEEEEGESPDPHEGESGSDLSTGARTLQGKKPFAASLPDGTRLTLPAINLSGTLTSLTLSKEYSSPDLSATDIEPVSAVRIVSFDSFDPVRMGGRFADFTPSLTFPAADVAGQDPTTLTAVRVSDLLLGDDDLPGHISYLPVTKNAKGDYEITDFYFPDSIMSDLAQKKNVQKALRRPREIRYVLGTFKGSYNWKAQPQLERFFAAEDLPHKRTVWGNLTAEERNEEENKQIVNMVVLVHGHNEEEKEYGLNASAENPWYFAYKQDVWSPLYDYVLRTKEDILDCTAFYEFIYPTYKPIFTDTPGIPGGRLDQAFAREVNAEVESLLSMLPAGQELRLYIVAHSMGGLVARAGIQLFSANSHTAFQKLVTWGSPHMGGALVSMRYVLGAPGGIYRVGSEAYAATQPLGNIDNTLFALRRSIDQMQADTPGTRDLRYANSHTTTPYNLVLDQLFSMDISPAGDAALWHKYDLRSGTEIYNENLRLLNAEDSYRLSSKYHALFGVTSKRAQVELTWYYRPYVEGNEIAKGALVIPWLIEKAKDSYEGYTRGASDGAVNIASMIGAGVMGTRYSLGDVDHEEYYGAPTKDRFTRLDLAEKTLTSTFNALDIRPCTKTKLQIQSIAPSQGIIGCSVTIQGSGFQNAPRDSAGYIILNSDFFKTHKVTVGGVAAQLKDWNDNSITITVPEFSQKTGDVVVHAGKEKSNSKSFTSVLDVMIEKKFLRQEPTEAEIAALIAQGIIPDPPAYYYEWKAVVTSPAVMPLSFKWFENGQEYGTTAAVTVKSSTPGKEMKVEVKDSVGRSGTKSDLTGIADL